jgi:hypothetical protein
MKARVAVLRFDRGHTFERHLEYEIVGGVRGIGGTSSAWVTEDGLTVTAELILDEWTLVKGAGS